EASKLSVAEVSKLSLAELSVQKQGVEAQIADLQAQQQQLARDEHRKKMSVQRAAVRSRLKGDALKTDEELDAIAAAKFSDADGQRLLEAIRGRFPVVGDMLDE